MDRRPTLDRNISVQDFKEFYWLKKELIAFCKEEGLRRSGSKIEIADRIAHFLKTGEDRIVTKKKRKTSTFDWNVATLTTDTIITDSYKNTQNVRAFFEQQIGTPFRFNAEFMNWMKSNTGKTLDEAIEAWKRIKLEKKNSKTPKKIPPQLEYITYLRDYFAANPQGDRATGIKLWKIKRSVRGDNVYRASDLNWLTKHE